MTTKQKGKQKTSKKTLAQSISDPATNYARSVVSGETIAGPHVRGACKRHLKDLKEGHKRGLHWDIDQVEWVIGYFRDVLRLNGGVYEGVPFEVFPWEAFVLGSLFGWKNKEDGSRRFRVAYIETGKGSGKSPLAAGVGLYGLTSDGEERAEIYAAATKKDQAMILFRDAVAMVDQSPHLLARVHQSGAKGKVWNLAHHDTNSFFRPISADDGQSGPRPHIALVDEVHEHRGPTVVEMLRAGTKSRLQALIFMITNSGVNRTSVCYDYHDYGVKVASGMRKDDSFFAYICALDKGENPLTDESCWPKVNPSLGHGLPGLKYLREQVAQARGMPSKEALVRRINFCQWVDSASPFISPDIWFAAEDKEFDRELLAGRKCYGGLDLSSTTDLTALVLQFEPTDTDPFWRQLSFFWIPEDLLAEKEDKDRVPYLAWCNAGYLNAIPGQAINKIAILRMLAQIVAHYDLQGLAYDEWRMADLLVLIAQEGLDITLTPFRQGFKSMSPALDEYETRLINGKLKHDGNPVMTMCAANAVPVMDPAGNRKLDKKKAIGRIDGMITSVMATGVSSQSEPEQDISAFINDPIIL